MRWTRSPVFIALVAVIDVAVLLLAYLAVHHQRTPVAGPAPVATSTADAAPTTLPIVGPLSLAVSPSGGLMRVTRGTCDRRDPVRAQVWVAPTYLAPLRRVSVPGLQEALGTTMTDSALTIAGADAACKVHGYTSADGGKSWQTVVAPKDLWRLDTDSSASLVHGPLPGGVLNIDCVPIAVSTIAGGDRALITCSGFNVIDQPRRRTVTPITYGVDAPVAATQQGKRLLVLATSDTCLASLRRVTSQAGTQQVACLGRTGAPLAVAAAGDRVFAQVGERLSYSGNAGGTFRTYPDDAATGSTGQ